MRAAIWCRFTCKRLRYSQTFGGISSVQWRKVGGIWRFIISCVLESKQIYSSAWIVDFRSFRMRSVTLSTLFLGKPPRQFTILSAHSFASNWQLLFLNQRKRANGRRIFSWPSLHERMCWTWESNSGPLACQADTLPIELPCPAWVAESVSCKHINHSRFALVIWSPL